MIRRIKLSAIIISLSITTLFTACNKKGDVAVSSFYLPYPDAKMALYYQSLVDSSKFLWFTTVKGAASAFMNEEVPEITVSTNEVVIVNEALFRATADVQLPDKILTLTMKRAFQDKGDHSIWQVTQVEEKKWPKNKSK